MGQYLSTVYRYRWPVIHSINIYLGIQSYYKPNHIHDTLLICFTSLSMLKLLSDRSKSPRPPRLPILRYKWPAIYALNLYLAVQYYYKANHGNGFPLICLSCVSITKLLCDRRSSHPRPPGLPINDDPQDSPDPHNPPDSPDSRFQPQQYVATTIGIFSRSAEDEYNWLTRRLGKKYKVQSFFISNTNHQAFRESVSNCHIAILYHSKTRGRVNITDVTDSLYDTELEFMARTRGKKKVFVVVDDLDDSSINTKQSILQNQPSIHLLAGDVFLFSREDKRNDETMTEKVVQIVQHF
ncbi:uncharacterized protein LOC134571065 [Pelobates fuscus]|uniref:uncharacterized protein LOC134571065 n=1 Tax=Pelobates fuscus TaxID=191477 RepID=UPI002FE443C0